MARTERQQPDLISYLRQLREDVDMLLRRDVHSYSGLSGMATGDYLNPGLAFTSQPYTGFWTLAAWTSYSVLAISVNTTSYHDTSYKSYDKGVASATFKSNSYYFTDLGLYIPWYRDSKRRRYIMIGGNGWGSIDAYVPLGYYYADKLRFYPSTFGVSPSIPGGLFVKSGTIHLIHLYSSATGADEYNWDDPGAFTSLEVGHDYAALSRCDGRSSITLRAPSTMGSETGGYDTSYVDLRLAEWRNGIDPDDAILCRIGMRENMLYDDDGRIASDPRTLDFTHDSKIVLNEDTDTYLKYVGADNWAFYMGSRKVLDLAGDGIKIYVAGSAQTVLCGANDSGGTGYRLLRVANGTGSSGSSDASVTPTPINCVARFGVRWTIGGYLDTTYYFGVRVSGKKSPATINCVATCATRSPVHKASPVVQTINAVVEIPTPTLKRSARITAATINTVTAVPLPNFRGRATPTTINVVVEIPEPNIRGDS